MTQFSFSRTEKFLMVCIDDHLWINAYELICVYRGNNLQTELIFTDDTRVPVNVSVQKVMDAVKKGFDNAEKRETKD